MRTEFKNNLYFNLYNNKIFFTITSLIIVMVGGEGRPTCAAVRR